MKLNINIEESTHLLKLTEAAASSKRTHVTGDFVGTSCVMNKDTINLAQLPSIPKCNQTNNLVILKIIL